RVEHAFLRLDGNCRRKIAVAKPGGVRAQRAGRLSGGKQLRPLRVALHQSAWILAAEMIFAYLATSRPKNAASSSGVLPTGSAPSLTRCFLTSGSARPFPVAARS